MPELIITQKCRIVGVLTVIFTYFIPIILEKIISEFLKIFTMNCEVEENLM